MNNEAQDHAEGRLREEVAKLPPDERDNLLVKADIADDLAADLIRDIPPAQLATAAAGGYVKLFAYSSVVEVFRRLEIKVTFLRDLDRIGEIVGSPAMWAVGLSQLIVFALRALQLLGIVVGIRDRHARPAVLLAVAVVAATAAVTIAVGTIRFRAPAEPALVLLTVVGGQRLLDLYRRRRLSDATETV